MATTRYSIGNRLNYENATKLVQDLEKAGIDANITQGGIQINPTMNQVAKMQNIAEKYGVSAVAGKTMFENNLPHRPKQ